MLICLKMHLMKIQKVVTMSTTCHQTNSVRILIKIIEWFSILLCFYIRHSLLSIFFSLNVLLQSYYSAAILRPVETLVRSFLWSWSSGIHTMQRLLVESPHRDRVLFVELQTQSQLELRSHSRLCFIQNRFLTLYNVNFYQHKFVPVQNVRSVARYTILL